MLTNDPPEISENGEQPASAVAVATSAPKGRRVGVTFFESSIGFIVFLLIGAGFGIWEGGSFLSVDGRLLDLHQNVPIVILSLAALVTITPGMFDLSIAGVASLTTMMAIGLVVNQGIPLWLALILCLLMGMTVGLVNAFLVERVRVNAFIATLGTGGIAAGIGDTYAGGTVVSPGVGGHPLPNWFTDFGDFQYKAPGWLILAFVALIALMIFFNADRVRPEAMDERRWLLLKVGVTAAIIVAAVLAFPVWAWMSDVSWMIVALLVVSLVIWVLMEQTTYGRHLRAIGSNRPAAVLAGVNTRRQVYKTFILAGAIAAFAGICLAAVSGAAEPDAAATYLLPAFAAVFLSTVVLSHGRFTVTGTIVSGAFVVWIGIGLIIGGINANAVDVLNGVVLVGAVGLATVVRRK